MYIYALSQGVVLGFSFILQDHATSFLGDKFPLLLIPFPSPSRRSLWKLSFLGGLLFQKSVSHININRLSFLCQARLALSTNFTATNKTLLCARKPRSHGE